MEGVKEGERRILLNAFLHTAAAGILWSRPVCRQMSSVQAAAGLRVARLVGGLGGSSFASDQD